MFRLLALLLISFSGGCASLPEGARWGEDATYRPGWERIRLSAIDAARDPRVWIPAVGAGVLQLGDWDEEVSDWAVEHTPVFGSPRSADDWSDGLRAASILAYHASVLALPRRRRQLAARQGERLRRRHQCRGCDRPGDTATEIKHRSAAPQRNGSRKFSLGACLYHRGVYAADIEEPGMERRR